MHGTAVAMQKFERKAMLRLVDKRRLAEGQASLTDLVQMSEWSE